MEKKIRQMEEQEVIQLFSSNWENPITLVTMEKRDNRLLHKILQVVMLSLKWMLSREQQIFITQDLALGY